MNSSSLPAMSKAAGIALIAGALLSVFFMLHHPSTAADSLGAALQEIRTESGIAAWVHGLLIAVMTGIWFGTFGLTARLGADRPLPVLGFMLFTLGTLGYFLAASVSGFIVPQIGNEFAERTPEQMENARAMLVMAGATNQVFAGAGVIGTASGILAWSLTMLQRTAATRWVGFFGIAVAVVPAALLLGGTLRLHVGGMTAVVVAHGAWYLLAGGLLLRGGMGEG